MLCEPSGSDDPVTRHILDNFVIEDVVAGLEEELPLPRHATSGALADTKG